jgi:hypothetical protein
MAKTRSRRRRKHRGTQAGTVEQSTRSRPAGKPRTRPEARESARQRRLDRMSQPPSWRGTLNRAAIAASILVLFVLVVMRKPPAQALVLGVLSLLLYVPMGFAIDRFMYRRAQRQRPAGGRRGG